MKFIKKMIFFSLILLFAAGCDSNSAANKEELEKTDLEDSLKNLKNEDTKTKEANTADDELQVLKEKGLAAYLKLKKGK